jgi:REP element-mobilizing transposase RayT
MALNNNLPYRQSLRMPGFDYRQPGAYFITVCTHRREPVFGHLSQGIMHLNAAGRMAQSVWEDLPAFYPHIEIDEFIVMPDHFHGIVVIHPVVGAIHESPLPITVAERRGMTIPKLVGRFKMQTAKQINVSRNMSGVPLWQRNYWERILRDAREWAAVRAYIRDNPRRASQK